MDNPRLAELARFLVKAKKGTYAGDGKEVTSQRPDFKELEFVDGVWVYRDSYAGFYCAPGQEVVRHNGKVFWTMSYDGGMAEKYIGDLAFAKQTFGFLKNALERVEESSPFRGPASFDDGDFKYRCNVKGNVARFRGSENISYRGNVVFSQDFFGGLVIGKDFQKGL